MSARDDSAGRRNAAVLLATAVTVGLLFLYPTSTNRGDAQRRPGQSVAAAGIVTPTATPGAAATGNTSSFVVNGSSADTVYGPVQVQLKVSAGRIVGAVAIDYPQSGGRDREINSIAIPLLQQETVATQTAQIDVVSGATYTSEGYIQSLQSALDAAHLK